MFYEVGMLDQFVVANKCVEVGGKESQIYSLAAAGRAQLEKEAENWSRLSAAINLVVETT